MNIDIVCVGKVKERYLRDAIDEYRKRLSRFAKVDVIEVADEKTRNTPPTRSTRRSRRRRASASSSICATVPSLLRSQSKAIS